MSIQIAVKDEREITVPVPATGPETIQATGFCAQAAADGYVLAAASTVKSGHQRDPYTSGIKLTFRKTP